MITILTTGKAFSGQTRLHQINALKSWQAVIPDVEILLFGAGEGFAEVAQQLRLVHIPQVETSTQGTPLHNSMFALAQSRSRYDIRAFISCDIILLDDFVPAIRRIDFDRFLMIGQRWDIDLDREIDFQDQSWTFGLRQELQQRAVLHGPWGSDYFVYRGSIWDDLPPVIVGRGYEDNELIYHCRAHRVPVIDGSESIIILHQNHHHGHHPQGMGGVYEGEEAQSNRRAFLKLQGRGIVFTTVDSNWRLTANGLVRNFCRGNLIRCLQSRYTLSAGTPSGRLLGAMLTAVRSASRAVRSLHKVRVERP